MTWQLPGYEPIRELGRGSMGEVVLARQVSLNRQVAVKHLRFDVSGPQRARLAREGRALAQLDCPNVVRVIGLQESGTNLYLILEFIDGPPLSRGLASGPLHRPDGLAVLSQLAAALEYIHERGVIHRDVKPSNVLVSSQGICKLNDFGLVRLLSVAQGAPLPMTVLTREGMPIGTAAYMAPEAVLGDRMVDARADLYSLAVLGYFLLLGQLPFPESLGLLPMLNAQLHSAPPAPADLDPQFPDAVATVLLQGLAKDREDRQPDVATFWRALDAAASVAWPGWWAQADLAKLAAASAVDADDGAGESMSPRLAPAPGFGLPLVAPAMPPLRAPRRSTGRILSAAIGLAVAVAVFVVLGILLH